MACLYISQYNAFACGLSLDKLSPPCYLDDNSYGFLNLILKNFVIIRKAFVMYNKGTPSYYTQCDERYTPHRTFIGRSS